MKDTDIKIFEPDDVSCDEKDIALPVNFITVGNVESDSVRVYIKQNVYKRIEKYAKTEMSKEVGSILVGDYTEDNGKTTVIISDYIEAKYTDATASTLTFTHETWDYVYKEKDKKYPEKKIVGWQHTHPGYGIFLSNYDIFIQENFFNLPWQMAYVVDPIADTRGFFEWKGSKTSKMSGFYVYDEVGREIKISEKSKPTRKNISVASVVLAFFLVVAVITAASFAIEKNNIEKRLNKTLKLVRQTDLTTDDDKAVPKQPEDTETFRVYEVQKGDYIVKICEKYNLDFAENIEKIIAVNNIENIDKIYTGQRLYLPLENGQ